jgi:hypothetical protein
MIASEIRSALTDSRIGVTAYQFQAPENATYPHITYTYINDRGMLYSEGDSDYVWSEVQIDIYHKSNYNALLTTVLNVMKEKGFHVTNGWGRYDKDINVYYYTLRVLKEIEDGSY